MSKNKVTTELFTIPYRDGNSVLYAPLLGFACIANADLFNFIANIENVNDQMITPEHKRLLDYLIEKQVVNGTQTLSLKVVHHAQPAPQKLALFPTNRCNLKCRYCYAAVDNLQAKTMDWDIAVSSIQYFSDLMKKENRKVFPLEFHGGGEPFCAWKLIQQIIAFAEERCVQEGFELKVYAATNGILDDRQLEWIRKHFTFLLVSFDVLPHVQNYHRATADESGSFEFVDRALRFFDQYHFPYGIRCTVSKYNENLLEETIDFICQNYKTKLLFLEPVSICGRCAEDTNQLKPDLYKFIENFKQLEPLCTAQGMRLEYSGAQFEKIAPTFCYVGTDNFSVTPDGYLTNCWEVTSQEHPLANTFIFGKMLPGAKIAVDQSKLNFLRSLSVDKLDYCQDCFARWHCAGDCVTRLGHNRYSGQRGGERCETNRQIIAHRIIQMLEREDYFQKI